MSINNISPLPPNLINLLNPVAAATGVTEFGTPETGSFADILTESFKTASQTDSSDKISALDLLTGQSDDMSGLLLDAAKAEISLTLALQIRNKVIDAYNEIMRMQV